MQGGEPIEEAAAVDLPGGLPGASGSADPPIAGPGADEGTDGGAIADHRAGEDPSDADPTRPQGSAADDEGYDDPSGVGSPPDDVGDRPADGSVSYDAPLDGADICPFLAVPGARWRRIAPDRDHRCLAVRPPGPLTPEKQRRLCLTATHVLCPAYEQAVEGRAAALASAGLTAAGIASRRSRPYVRTAPLVIDPGPAWRRREPAPPGLRRLGQVAVVALILVAVLAFVWARLIGTGPSGGASSPPAGGVAEGGPSPASSSSGAGTPAPAGSSAPAARPSTAGQSAAASPPRPTGSAAAAPTGSPAPGSPASSASPGPGASSSAPALTYTVRSGDTLSAIAIRFHTTVQAIAAANGITNPSLIHTGQVLTIP